MDMLLASPLILADNRPHQEGCNCYRCEEWDRSMAAAVEKHIPHKLATQKIIGYRLRQGHNKMDCFFLPGRHRKTLDTVADHMKAGWVLVEVLHAGKEKEQDQSN